MTSTSNHTSHKTANHTAITAIENATHSIKNTLDAYLLMIKHCQLTYDEREKIAASAVPMIMELQEIVRVLAKDIEERDAEILKLRQHIDSLSVL